MCRGQVSRLDEQGHLPLPCLVEAVWKASGHPSPPLQSPPFGSCCQMCFGNDPNMKCGPCSKCNTLPGMRSVFPKPEFTDHPHQLLLGRLAECMASTLDLGEQTLWVRPGALHFNCAQVVLMHLRALVPSVICREERERRFNWAPRGAPPLGSLASPKGESPSPLPSSPKPPQQTNPAPVASAHPQGSRHPGPGPSIRFHLLSLSEPVHYPFIIPILLLIIINNHSRQARVLTAPPLVHSFCLFSSCLLIGH